jgi:hypothetical protein
MSSYLQVPSFRRPYIENDNIRMMLDDIERRDGNPLSDAENLLRVAEILMDVGLNTIPKETVWAQMESFFIYLNENYPSNFFDDDEQGEEIVILSLNNRLYLEDYCASSMIRNQLDLLTKNTFKRDKLKSLYFESYASSTALKGADEDFEPFKLELKDEARQWFKAIPEKSAFAEQGRVQPHVRAPLNQFLKEIRE